MTRNRVSISLSVLATRFIFSTATFTRTWEIDDRCVGRNLLGNDGKATDEATAFDDNLLAEGSRIISSAERKDTLEVDSFSFSDLQEIDSSNGRRLRGGQSSKTSEDKNYQADQRHLQGFIREYQLLSEQLRGDQPEDNQEENNQQEGDQEYQLGGGQPERDPEEGAQQIEQFQQEGDQLGNGQTGGDRLEDNQEEEEQEEDDQSYQVAVGQLGGDPRGGAQQIQQSQSEGDQWGDDQQMEGDSFHMRVHWYPGACWQEEWREREWCMECPGKRCDVDDWLWVEECAPTPTQRFQWVPNSNINNNNSTFSEGQLKTAFWNLCFERTDTRIFRLQECDASNQNQFFIRPSMGVVFELHPAHNTSMCLTQHHHPKDYEEVYGMSCSDARNSHTSYWNTNWQGERDFNLGEYEDCTSSQPCGRCMGDCDNDRDCEEGLSCFFRDDITPVPGCSGIGRSGTDYCVIPPAENYDFIDETAVDVDEENGNENLVSPTVEIPPGNYDDADDTAVNVEEENGDENIISATVEIPAGNDDGADDTAVDVEEENGEENVVSPLSFTVEMRDTKCTDISPCRMCEGLCDSEDQCDGDLKCFQTWNSEAIGCLGRAPLGFTYCMDPSYVDQGILRDRQPGCTDESPCNKCEGGCNSDSQCEGDLSCFFRDGDEEVPDCIGRGITGRDYCVNAANLNFVLYQLWNRITTDTDFDPTFVDFP